MIISLGGFAQRIQNGGHFLSYLCANNNNICSFNKKFIMNSKKQQSASSSESTSSSSSNSSSSSSSSSGSDSSSSDSEGTSSSQNSNKSGPDNEKTLPKRVKPVASNVKQKQKQEEKKVVPIKQPPVKKGAAIYSSESDESLTKSAIGKRRLSNTKPKVSATVSVIQKGTKTNTRPVRNSRSENSHKPASEKPVKNTKARSIFSPDNSSESDVEKNTKSSGVSCNTRSITKSALNNKLKENDVKKNWKRSRSSASATTSESTESSSDSDSSDNSSVINNKIKPKTMSDKQDSEKTESENSRNQTIKSKTSESSEVESSKRRVITRKLTRSSSARRSKHLIGKLGTDTESETDSKTSKTGKKVGPKGPIMRNKNSKGLPCKAASTLHCEVQAERKCPVEGCNGLGHLGGNYEKHFTLEACPLYHNKTVEDCRQMAEERKKKEEERKRALLHMSRRSPKSYSHHLNSEQRSYQLMVKDLREKFQEKIEANDVKGEEKEKEPRLEGIASEHDLRLFREAQAVASEKIEDDLKSLPNMKQTKYVEMGRFEMEVWYQSPYPEDYARLPKLYLCEYCLKYMKTRTILKRHVVKCVWRHPPGEEVYRKDRLSVWEVDGKRYKQYCQNLCLLAKFFLDHKTLYYDVEPFLFYVMTIGDSEGCHTVGYFSKEKNSFLNYNVSCILTLPPYQRQGYGRLLIDFSYLLTREEGKIGSPEKPLSDLGLISYRSYWKDVLLEYLCNFAGKEISIKDISQEMAINSYDIVSTLQALGMMKYWKGKHIILKKQDEIEEYIERAKRRDLAHKEIDKKCLKWAPFTAAPPQNSS